MEHLISWIMSVLITSITLWLIAEKETKSQLLYI